MKKLSQGTLPTALPVRRPDEIGMEGGLWQASTFGGKEILEKTGIKPTYERLRILKYLEKNNNHPTINMIYEDVVKDIPTISKTTVYNALNLFVEKGLVLPLVITGTEIRYDRNTKPHHHFLCEKCGKIYDIDIECPYFKKGYVDGHKIKELHGYFKGICKECLQKEIKKVE